MSCPLPNSQMSALAYLYDHALDLPTWFRRLTARQLKDIAQVMIHWKAATENQGIVPMEEIEKREVLGAVVMCEGNILKAAKLLKIGKTTVYRKLTQWGYSVQNRVLMEQPSALSGTNEAQTRIFIRADDASYAAPETTAHATATESESRVADWPYRPGVAHRERHSKGIRS